MHAWLQIGELFARVSMGAILNSLWQGLLLVFVAWLCLRFVPRSSASLRYGIWCVALVAVLALPLIAVQTAGSGLTGHAATGSEPAVAVPQRFAQFLFAVWYVSASVLVIRLILSYVRLQQLKASAVPLPPLYQHQVRRWLAAAGGRRTCRLCVSNRVPMPVAIGLLDPVIILPERLIEQLSDEEFDQIGLHEVAHLQRWDDYTNVFQKIVEALLFFNPAVYLIGRQLTLEREIACDDRVIAATGKPLTYALCLTRLVEATALARQPLHALGALSTRRQFAIRIERLLDRRGSVPAASRFAAAAACVGIAASLVVAARVGSLIGIAPDNVDQRSLAMHAQEIRQLARIVVTPRRQVAFAIATASTHQASAHAAPIVRVVDVRRLIAVARPNAVGARNFNANVVEIVAADAHGYWVAARRPSEASRYGVFYVWSAPSSQAPVRSAATIADAKLDASDAQFEALSSLAASDVAISRQVTQIAQLEVRISRGSHHVKHIQVRFVSPRVAAASEGDVATDIALAKSVAAMGPNVEELRADAVPVATVATTPAAPAVPATMAVPPVPTMPAPPAQPATSAAMHALAEAAQAQAAESRAIVAAAQAQVAAGRALAAKRIADALAEADTLKEKIQLLEELTNFGDLQAARDALINALDDESLAVKVIAIRSLARHLDRPADRAALIRALRSSDSPAVQLHIIAAFMCDVGDEQVRKVLAETMLRDDVTVSVQVAAAEALAPVASDPEVRAAFQQAGGSSGSATVRAIVTHALLEHPNN
jgi:beta-lactamase regulating signal transducer with metallopeptidase domain